MGGDIGKHELAHGHPGFNRSTALMRHQYGVRRGEEFLADLRLTNENIKASRCDRAAVQGGEQRILVDDGAARDVDQNAAWDRVPSAHPH